MINQQVRRFIEQGLIIVLIINTLLSFFFTVYYPFNLEYWKSLFNHFDFSIFFQMIRQITGYIADLCVIIGGIQMIINKKFSLPKLYRFPIYFLIANSLFWFITTQLSTEFNFIFQTYEADATYYIFRGLHLFLIILAVAFYGSAPTVAQRSSKHKEVGKGSRFLNYVIDLLAITILVVPNINILSHGTIFDSDSILNESPYWFFSLNMFFYYFILELLFGQTFGKLVTQTHVAYTDQRWGTILIRTLCRFIPFEAFSFFGKKGWHDSISKTEVVKIDQHPA